MTPRRIAWPDLATPERERFDALAAATAAAGSAAVELFTESTTGRPHSYDRTLRGDIDFQSSRAKLVLNSREGKSCEIVIDHGRRYERVIGSEGPWLLDERTDDDRDLTADGFGLFTLARGIQEVLEDHGPAQGPGAIRMRVTDALLYDDLSATDVFGIPTAVMPEPLLAELTIDPHGRIESLTLAPENRPKMDVQRRRFGIRLSDFGKRVDVEIPSADNVQPRPRDRSWIRRLLRMLRVPLPGELR